MRKTKIVCTLGPASRDEETIRQLCLAGMNVARLNFSHDVHETHKKTIDTIKKVRAELGLPVAIMLDTKGPECRIRTFENGSVDLKDGDTFTFTTEDVTGNCEIVSVSYPDLPSELEKGDRILLNDGLIETRVEKIEGSRIICTVVYGGHLSDRKSMNFPGKVLSRNYVSEADISDIRFGMENDVDYIACSFVSKKSDLIEVKKILGDKAKEIELIAKIENQSGVDNIEEICEECDGIMVARGDMGVEIPFERLPSIQKELINKCSLLGKRVITATEMLESMVNNPRPTRAEISDVANAVYDGTSAIMLSGETAAGKYPVLALQTMAKIAENTENSINYIKRFRGRNFIIKNSVDAISHATCGMAIDVGVKAVVACSISGMTVRMVSRFRPPMDIIGLTTNEKTWRKLALSWGVIPKMTKIMPSTEVLFYTAKQVAEETCALEKDDKIIITGGITNGMSGNTNLIKIETI